MKILVVGATGYIGSVVAERLAGRGHQVVALVRQAGRVPYEERVGDLGDPASLPSEEFDAIVHAGQLTGDEPTDVATIGKLGRVHYVSGVWVLGDTEDGAEDSPVNPIAIVGYRPTVERLVLDGGGSVIRPGVVHGRGQGIPALLRAWAAERGHGVYVSADGRVPTWSFVHVDDLVDLIVAAVEHKASGQVFHGVSEAVSLDVVAGAIAPDPRPWPVSEAAQVVGAAFAEALALSQRVSSARTRTTLGWHPNRPGILSDLEEGSYTA
ncbi:NAD-dependent epimerase/dehydratase family protein [Nonomuraea sp. NPDC050663]|uniref:NAD-dependent epimerase/dehydratase family protein n=1 Tax=Nonomuraea sp. NPDC050663 TaxID=3364370 RepID=UPI0037A4D148